MKRWLAVVFAVAALTTVSGCDFRNNHQGPVAVSVAGGQLEIAVCSSMRAEGLSAYYAEGRGEWIEFLHTNGQAELTPETVISATTIDSVFANHTIAEELDLSSTTRLSIVVYGSDSPNLTAAFDLKLDDLDDGAWQHPDGTISNEPCPQADL